MDNKTRTLDFVLFSGKPNDKVFSVKALLDTYAQIVGLIDDRNIDIYITGSLGLYLFHDDPIIRNTRGFRDLDIIVSEKDSQAVLAAINKHSIEFKLIAMPTTDTEYPDVCGESQPENKSYERHNIGDIPVCIFIKSDEYINTYLKVKGVNFASKVGIILKDGPYPGLYSYVNITNPIEAIGAKLRMLEKRLPLPTLSYNINKAKQHCMDIVSYFDWLALQVSKHNAAPQSPTKPTDSQQSDSVDLPW